MSNAGDLRGAAQSYQSKLTLFLQDLVQIPSVNGKDPETYIARRIMQEAEALGLRSRLAAKDANRPNILVSLGEGKKGFLLVAHLDTVPIGDPSTWTHPPFSAEIENGILFGRGSADNKAGIACGLYTLALIRELNLLDLQKYQVLFVGVSDEESGASSPLGLKYLLEQNLISSQAAIYTYTSDVICIGHRGLLRLEIIAKGETIHTGSLAWSRGQGGINAVTSLAVILLKLEKLRLPFPRSKSFKGFNSTITPGTTFHGGEWQGMVPDRARATVDIRLMPGQDPQQILSTIQEIIQSEIKKLPGLKVKTNVIVSLPAAEIPVDHPLVRTAQKVARSISGREWPAVGAGPANEGYMLIQAGIPTLCGFGATGGNPHAPDEWVEIESLPQTVAMYAAIIQDYLKKS